ncbi:RND superfamily putative drug exporter [Kribbella sp. VKM Ac-2571]|uniref:MMPL family transporter n=1 Tax=Kribbella sp. VKM Ac-2571 TaxID=2512222 RepID=UPI00105E10B1|nr:MMPL family transporter [Kribbella sp. VKM Ac-2571]TDO58245.1 RND superfamily putative drug exporter [Kribbella sp. VKM Ac-2571]
MPASPRGEVRASRFERLAGWSQRHRWLALLVWIAVLVAVTIGARTAGTDYHNDFSLPGTESQQALDTLKAQAPDRAGATVQIVVQASGGLRDAGTRERVERMLAEVRQVPHVVDVQSPYQQPHALSSDGTIGYAGVILDGQAQDVPTADVQKLMDTAQGAEGNGLRVELGGEAIAGAEEGGGGPAEGVGLLAALIILILLFGSFLAASLPIIVALFAVGSAIGLLVLASHLATVADFTTPLMILVGLGVGIDYALLLFSRYRKELLTSGDHAGAVRAAVDTAGRTVFFAACTVIIALLGLVVLGLGSLQGVAVAVALTVLVTMIASLTLLPALLTVMHRRIERGIRRRADKRREEEGTRWRRWSDFVQRRPLPIAIAGVLALLALAAPVLGMRLGFADAGNNNEDRTSRQAYDLLAQGFGPGFNGPLIVVVKGSAEAAGHAQHVLSSTAGVAVTTPPSSAGKPDLSTLIVVPTGKPQDSATRGLVTRLRTDVLPPLAAQTGATFLVGGPTAATEDFADAVANRLPAFVLVVIGLSAVLLMLVFRSVLIPVKAAVLNLLSVGAALGAITLVFQHGVLGHLIGVEPGPVEAFVPVMIFAIAFGLSMDYEVFLLSRMHEEWEHTRDAGRAVREGLADTGRIVTAAAAIMVVVFASFLLDPGRMLKQFGLGLAIAVLLDALVIRCLILPAVMRLFGARAWWLPGSLAQRLPRLALEGQHTTQVAGAPMDGAS